MPYKTKEAQAAYDRKRYLDNIERERERKRRYRLENPDKVKACQAGNYSRNREARLVQKREYYRANKDKILQYNREYQAKNPEQLQQWRAKYREVNRETIISRCDYLYAQSYYCNEARSHN